MTTTITTGTQLGPYEILLPLGAGGMGEVYRAKDSRLDRDVAIKVLPQHLSRSPEFKLRFEREAKSISQLTHANICTLYDVGHHDGTDYLVMELLEGETLAQRLTKGALPLEQVLKCGVEIASALDAAHRKGVIHRDLKPGNVMLTKAGAKLLDFGLAKSSGVMDSDPSAVTVSQPLTSKGTILGTFQYMAPEQLEGAEADARTDIFAFGAVLYEMATGKRAFDGTSRASLIASIMSSQPRPISDIQAMTPPALDRLVRKCLAKDPDARWQSSSDVADELRWITEGGPQAGISDAARRTHFSWLLAGAVAVVGVLAALGGVRWFAPTPPSPTVRRFTIAVPQVGAGFTNQARISPDGRRIVYFSGSRLWVRDLQRFEASEVLGSQDASSPFWSPDGTQIGFAKEKRIWTWPLSGGQSTPICTIPGVEGFNNAVWGNDGKIYFALYRGGLYEVAAGGGDPRLILSPDATEVDFHLPHLLPDGKHLVTVAHRVDGPNPVVVISLPGGKRKDLEDFEGMWAAAYSPTGHLLLTVDHGRQQILGVPFSESKPEITGEPFLVAAGGLYPSVSSNGLMVYSLGSSHAQRELAWVDRDGRVQSVVGQPQRGLDTPALSPDGRRVALAAYEKDNADIWIYDLARGTRSRLVSGPQDETMPLWAPTGERIVYASLGNVGASIMEVPADGAGAPRSLAEGRSPGYSPDGRTLVFQREEQGHSTLWHLDLESGTAPSRLSPSATQQEDQPRLSPDGIWLAYLSDEGGRNEVFVRRFPNGAQKQQVSLSGGAWPFWSRGGDAVYYWERDALMKVHIQTGENLALEAPRKLFSASDVGLVVSSDEKPAIDIAADGRFLVVRRSKQDPLDGLLVVENWFEEFRNR